jgi:hypothetical protein
MRTRSWLAGLGAGSLILAGVIAANPFDSVAQQDSTPPAQTNQEDDNGNATPVVGTPILRPAIDLVRAQEIALEGNAGAVVTGVELDGEDGVLAYDVELDNGAEVEVDATSGAVLETEQQGDDNERDDNGDVDENDNAQGDDNGQNGEEVEG